ncbi:hypothetical protein BDZ89DRAFT_748171 [Hymenopellis radicata]|nr:hypothetical protein BDZ89DRAFT_748171 [Hymenopellis radicata]
MSAVYTSNIVSASLSTIKPSAAGQLEGLGLAFRFSLASSSAMSSDISEPPTLCDNESFSASSSSASSSPSSSRASSTELPSIQDNASSYSRASFAGLIVQVVDDLEDSPYASCLEEDFFNSSFDCSLDSSFDSTDFEVDSSVTGDFITGAQARRVLSVQIFHNVSSISNRALFSIAECSPAPENDLRQTIPESIDSQPLCPLMAKSDARSIDSSVADLVATKRRRGAIRSFFKRCFRISKL